MPLFSRTIFCTLFYLCVVATTFADEPSQSEKGELVFSVRRWEGEYESTDIPGGVKTTPSTAAIYTMRADGSQLRQVVAIDGAVCSSPAYGSKGKWIYFQSNASGQYHLYRCRPDGSARAQLTSEKRPGSPWKSVYGLQVAATGNLLCTVYDGRSGRVAILSPETGEMKLVAPQLGYLYMSAMSPKGDAVVAAGPASGYRLWLLKLPAAFAEGDARLKGPSVNLAPDHPQSFAPQFTPDGQTIIYFRRDGDIYRVQRDGSGGRRLTRDNRYVEFRLSSKDRHGSTDGPRLSADGKRIGFIAIRNDVPNVCTVNIDGSGFRQLTNRKTPCGRVRWSPDGRQISFVSFVGKYPQLFIMSAAGGKARQMTPIDGAVNFVNWKPY